MVSAKNGEGARVGEGALRAVVRAAVVTGMAMVLLAGSSRALAVELYADFDSASLDVEASEVEDAESATPRITLAPIDVRWNGRWYFFEARDVAGKQPTFRVPLESDAGRAHRHNHRYVFSEDGGESYTYFAGEHDRGGGYFTFAHDEPFEQESVLVAYALPYPVEKTVEHTRQMGESAYVEPVPSADEDFVIDETPGTQEGGYTDARGREVPRLPLLGYRITDPDTADDEKLTVVYVSGNHASEHTAHYTLEGAVDFLLTDDPRAAELRERFVFYVYPQVNPEGRWAGYFRSSPEHPRLDHNRDWGDSHDNASLQILSEAIVEDTGGEAAVYIDFHSIRHRVHEVWDRSSGESEPFYRALSARNPVIAFHSAGAGENRARGWGREVLNAPVSFTSETGFNANWPVKRYHRYGRDYTLTILDIEQDLRAMVSEQ